VSGILGQKLCLRSCFLLFAITVLLRWPEDVAPHCRTRRWSSRLQPPRCWAVISSSPSEGVGPTSFFSASFPALLAATHGVKIARRFHRA